MRVVCFGEIMLRLSPPGFQRFVQAGSFDVVYGGGEANVAVSLANFGTNTAYVTKLPDNPLGQAAVNELRKYGVDTGPVIRGGERIGIYYLEKGAAQRPSKVIYDRKHSSISQVLPGEFDWNSILDGAGWFHFTGITPALGENVAEVTMEACKAAKAKGISVSCDLNYRKNLWSSEKAGQVMEKLMQFVDVCIANEEDAEKVFGIRADDTDISSGKLSNEGYKRVASELVKRFAIKKAAVTLRGSISASDNNWGAMLYDGKEYAFSTNYHVHIVDRVGAGDSFAAGLIYALVNGYNTVDAVEFAAAASCLKHSVEGDFNQVTVDEIKALIKDGGSGRVQR